MDVGLARLARLAGPAVCMLLLAACQPGPSSSVASPASPVAIATPASASAAGPSDAALPPADPIQGVVTHVDSTGLDSVTGFTLRAIDGRTYEFVIGRLRNAAEFPPGHLVEHAANSEPILVTFTAVGPAIVATRLDDAAIVGATTSPRATGTPAPS